MHGVARVSHSVVDRGVNGYVAKKHGFKPLLSVSSIANSRFDDTIVRGEQKFKFELLLISNCNLDKESKKTAFTE